MLSFKYLGPKPPLKDKMKLCPCAHEGAAASHSVEEFCALGEDNAADPFYSFQVSDLPPHLNPPASALTPTSSPPTHSYHGGHVVL